MWGEGKSLWRFISSLRRSFFLIWSWLFILMNLGFGLMRFEFFILMIFMDFGFFKDIYLLFFF